MNHQGPFIATTISFNLASGQVAQRRQRRHRPGDARSVCRPQSRQLPGHRADVPAIAAPPFLLMIVAAIIAIYLVLGILYESYIHPITVVSTLPSAGVGAMLALLLFHTSSHPRS